MNQRNGTDVDAANTMRVFTKLGYKVKVYNDQTVDQIKNVLISGEFDGKFMRNGFKMASHKAEQHHTTCKYQKHCSLVVFFPFVCQRQRKITAAVPHSSVFC